jgi:hypothetical protein
MPQGIYKNTEIKDFYLDIWEADGFDVPPSLDDEEVTIESKYHLRPDLMAYDRYGDPALWWKIAMRNKDLLVDPINDFTSGLVIWVPGKV